MKSDLSLTLPNFIIIGAQKAGTTAAARNLSLHPQVQVFSGTTEYGQKEIEYFNQHWHRGNDWYASHFSKGPHINGEKTAELLHRTICHSRMHSVNPNFKIIVLLRNPIDRAYSQWKMATFSKHDEDATFNEVVNQELALFEAPEATESFYACNVTNKTCWREGYIQKGMYAFQLASLFRWFPRKQVHIAISERILKSMASEYNSMYRFLGVTPFVASYREHFVSKSSVPLSRRMRDKLKMIYTQPNRELFNLLGTEIQEWD